MSERYSKLTINDREYYFTRESGEFDGTATVFIFPSGSPGLRGLRARPAPFLAAVSLTSPILGSTIPHVLAAQHAR